MPKTVISLDYTPGDEPLYHALMSLIEGHSTSEAMPSLMAAMSHVLVIEADGDHKALMHSVTEAFRAVMQGSLNLYEIAEQLRRDKRNPESALQAARIAASIKSRSKQ